MDNTLTYQEFLEEIETSKDNPEALKAIWEKIYRERYQYSLVELSGLYKELLKYDIPKNINLENVLSWIRSTDEYKKMVFNKLKKSMSSKEYQAQVLN